jgi:hypothetical protein
MLEFDFFITNLVLFVVERFLEVLCKNHFGTISSLIQFKYASILNKTIVSI